MASTLKANYEMDVDDTTVTICRLCAEMISAKSYIPLYTDDKREQIVAKQINQLVNNLVSPNDGLPQDVCLNCAENVGKFYIFVSNIIETQNKLRRIMQLPEIKKMGSTEEEHQFSFLSTDNTWQSVHDGPVITACKVNNTRLNGKPNNEITSQTIIQEKSPASTNSARIAVSNNVSLTSPRRQTTIASRTLLPKPNSPIFRCSDCGKTFNMKSDCLRHIVRAHQDVKKTIGSDTIFTVINDGTNETRTKQKTNTNGPSSNLLSKHATTKDSACPSLQTTKAANVQPKSVTFSTTEPENGNNEMKPKGRRRKILALDGFLKEVHKQVSRYICDVCGRAMTSQFAFARHLREHDWSDEEDEICEKKKINEKENDRLKITRPIVGYCEFCKLLVSHSVRHKMYHDITKLETDYPNVVKLLNL